MHGADLVRGERLSEQIDGGHLSAEHSLFIQLRRRTDVAFVERLETSQHVIKRRPLLNSLKSGTKLAMLQFRS